MPVTSPTVNPTSCPWDGPGQREAYTWFTIELANLRTAFRWAADGGDLDVAATIATCAAFLGRPSVTTSRLAGPKNSSNPLAAPAIRGLAAGPQVLRLDDHRIADMDGVVVPGCVVRAEIDAAVTDVGVALRVH